MADRKMTPGEYGMLPCELDILKQIALGKSNREIAQDSGVALEEVRSQVDSILSKLSEVAPLETHRRTAVASFAVKNHWF